MAAASNYTMANVMNALLRGVAFPLPAHTYIALHTGDPTPSALGEVSTANWPAYVRRQAEAGGAIGSGWTAPITGECKNPNQLTYPGQDGMASVEVTHWSVWDAAVGGNMLTFAQLQTPRVLMTGDVFVFDTYALSNKLT